MKLRVWIVVLVCAVIILFFAGCNSSANLSPATR